MFDEEHFFNTYSSFTRARRLGLAGKISIKPEDVRRFHAILSAPVDETENIHSVGAPSKMTVASDGFDGMLQGQKSVPAYDDGDDDEAAFGGFLDKAQSRHKTQAEVLSAHLPLLRYVVGL